MWKKITSFPLTVYMATQSLVKELKEDERGLSGVVVTVLLILVSVLAVVLIWGFVSGWLGELWTRITGEAARIR